MLSLLLQPRKAPVQRCARQRVASHMPDMCICKYEPHMYMCVCLQLQNCVARIYRKLLTCLTCAYVSMSPICMCVYVCTVYSYTAMSNAYIHA